MIVSGCGDNYTEVMTEEVDEQPEKRPVDSEKPRASEDDEAEAAEFERMMAIAQGVMHRYRKALQELAKN